MQISGILVTKKSEQFGNNSDFSVIKKVRTVLSFTGMKAIFKYSSLNFKNTRFGMYVFQSNQPNKEKLTFFICFRRFKVNFPV